MIIVLFWNSLIGGVPIGIVTIHLGILGYFLLSLCTIPILSSRRRPEHSLLWVFLMTTTLSDIVVMAARGTSGSFGMRRIAAGAIIPAVLLALPMGLSRHRKRAARGPKGKHILFIHVIAVLAILFFQASNRLMRFRGIPNEQRSLMFGGIEVHHINLGIGLILMLAFVWPENEPQSAIRIFLTPPPAAARRPGFPRRR